METTQELFNKRLNEANEHLDELQKFIQMFLHLKPGHHRTFIVGWMKHIRESTNRSFEMQEYEGK